MSDRAPYLLSGSFAYDTVMRHDGAFSTHILPEAVDKLSVAFGVHAAAPAFGGTGGNIAYNAGLLGQAPQLVGSVGPDAQAYLDWLAENRQNIVTLTPSPRPTAHAYICGDVKSNQITFFSPGAMHTRPNLPAETPDLWHLAPDILETMVFLAETAQNRGKHYFFDPGQCLPAFLEDVHGCGLPDILRFATGIFLNEYEADLLTKATGVPLEHWLASQRDFIVRTLGGNGVELLTLHGKQRFDVAPAKRIADATGCGDALRAGFLYGYTSGWRLEQCVELGAVMGAFAIEQEGGQNHRATATQVFDRLLQYRDINATRAA